MITFSKTNFNMLFVKKLIVLLIFLVTVMYIAKVQDVDSLENELLIENIFVNDQFTVYYELCRIYSDSNTNKFVEYTEKGVTFAKNEINYLLVAG